MTTHYLAAIFLHVDVVKYSALSKDFPRGFIFEIGLGLYRLTINVASYLQCTLLKCLYF